MKLLRSVMVFVAAFLLLSAGPRPPARRETPPPVRKSTVKIVCTFAAYDYCNPWKMKAHHVKVGSGAVIQGNMIITNAHVVSDATFIQVQKENDPVLYNAAVKHVSHEADLAVLTVEDRGFFRGTAALKFGGLPTLRSRVATYGYPIGGERISITEGVISRIEIGKYAHDGEAAFLMIQTDAAINPGNSGGPAIQDGRIVGLAFQHIAKTSNIGYLIPVPVIDHFLRDIRDGVYHGFPSLGIMTDKLQNSDHRRYLGMAVGRTGILVTRVIPGGSCEGRLREGDVITGIDGVAVASDGSVPLADGRIDYYHLVYSKQAGEGVTLGLIRDGKDISLLVTLKAVPKRIPWNNEHGRRPRYIIFSGLVFQPLSHEYLKCWGKWGEGADPGLMYPYYFYDRDRLAPWRREFVIISRVLPDESNTYVSGIHDRIVTEINGMKIGSMEDILEAVKKPQGGFHLITIQGINKPVVLNASEVSTADQRIMKKFRISPAALLER